MKAGELQRTGLLFGFWGWDAPSRDIDRASKNNMADACDDMFFFGDDLEAILGVLEEEEDLDEHFREAAADVSYRICFNS